MPSGHALGRGKRGQIICMEIFGARFAMERKKKDWGSRRVKEKKKYFEQQARFMKHGRNWIYWRRGNYEGPS